MNARAALTERARHLELIARARTGAAATRVGYPIRIRECGVARVVPLSASMMRLTLGGDGAGGFESHAPDEHVKLIFPDPDTGELRPPVPDGLMLAWPRPVPPSREYTVRRFDPATLEIDIDIVLHRGGLASDWARAASPGDRVHVAGPPGGVIVPLVYDRYLLAGDLTALPAIARWLEELPQSAAGWAFTEVTDPGDEIELQRPPGMQLRWVHSRDTPPGSGDLLARTVRTVHIPPGESVYLWAAGEAGAIKPLRRWARDELGLARHDYSVTGYWKRGTPDFDEDDDD